MEPEELSNSPYVFHEDQTSSTEPDLDPEEREIVIVDGTAMSYRAYRR